MPDRRTSERWAELPDRLAALAAVARDARVERLVLREPATLTWLLGARVHVPQTLDAACLDVVVEAVDGGAPRLTLVTNAIEAPRLQDTELGGIPAQWVVVPWWEPRDRRLPSDERTGTERPLSGAIDVAGRIAALRRVLSPQQQEQLAAVAREAAAAATRTAIALTPAHSEYTAAGLLASELLAAELEPVVLMVAGGDRGGRHRHALPTAAPLGNRAMLAYCARRHGLIASVTRFVSFEPLEGADRDAYQRLLGVEQAFLDATRPGARLGDVVTAGTEAYADMGLPADEWHRHHQGGLSGWQPREFPANRDSDIRLAEGMVVAWNPSSERWKVEDTAIVRPDGPELLVHDPRWPALTIGGRLRPDVLVLA